VLDSSPADKRLIVKGQCVCRCTYYEHAAIRLYPSKEHERALAVCFVRGRYTSGRSRVFRGPPLHLPTRIEYNSLYLNLSGKVQGDSVGASLHTKDHFRMEYITTCILHLHSGVCLRLWTPIERQGQPPGAKRREAPRGSQASSRSMDGACVLRREGARLQSRRRPYTGR
jgi:hypothetical protein